MNHKTLFLLTLSLSLLIADLQLAKIKSLFLLLTTPQAFLFLKVLLTFHSLPFHLLLFIKDFHLYFLILKMKLFDLKNQILLRNQLLVVPFILLLHQLFFQRLNLNFLFSLFLVNLLLKLCVSYLFVFWAFLVILMLVLLFMNVNFVTLNILLSFDNFD